MLSCLELLPNALVARTMRAVAPAAAGVPLMAPVEWFRVSPVGSVPPLKAQEIGVLPEAVRA
jgi:hypothetical protein